MRYSYLILALALGLSGCGAAKRLMGIEAPGGSPELMTRVIATKEGGGYKIQYSLQDGDLKDTSAKGTLGIRFVDYDDEEKIYFTKTWGVEKGDFKKYSTLFGGEVWGHVLIINNREVQGAGSEEFVKVKLFLITDSGKIFEAEDTMFL